VVSSAPDTHSLRLRRKLELVLPGLFKTGRRLFEHPHIRDLYPEYLFTSHCIIRASVPLMEAGRQAAARLDGDAVAADVDRYLAGHIGEESEHDEWLLDDMAALGLARQGILSRPPSPTIASLVGSQYYWILHYHPVALLGYISLLEGYPPIPDEIEQLRVRTGFPPEAFRTLMRHAELDPGHRDELNGVLDRLPLSREQEIAIGLSAMSSVQLMTQAIDELLDTVPAS
jgi:pyrroloquinoline quinone (PQQ) biosynthesis protein C